MKAKKWILPAGVVLLLVLVLFLIVGGNEKEAQPEPGPIKAISEPVQITGMDQETRAVLTEGMVKERDGYREINKGELSVAKADFKRDCVSGCKYKGAEYYIFRIKASDRNEKAKLKNVFYVARVKDNQFKRDSVFYDVSTDVFPGDYAVAERPELTFVFGWLADQKHYFEINGKAVKANEDGVVGMITGEKDLEVVIKVEK